MLMMTGRWSPLLVNCNTSIQILLLRRMQELAKRREERQHYLHDREYYSREEDHKILYVISIPSSLAHKKKNRRIMAPAPAEAEAATVLAQERGGRTHGTINYTLRETIYMLTTMRRILPIGPEQLANVVDTHEENWKTGRDKESITRKYASLHRK